MNKTVKGLISGILAAAFYGMNPLFALPLYADGMSTPSVLFLRYSIAIPILALMVRWRGKSFGVSRRQLCGLIIMGLLMGFSSLGLFESYNYMDAGIASSLLFVYPLMVALIMAIVFHEKLTLSTILCLGTAMVGIYLLYDGSNGAKLSLTGTMFVMLSSFAYALYIVGVNVKLMRSIPTLVMTFYALLFGWIVFAVQVVSGGLQFPDTTLCWLSLTGLAIIPTALSLVLTSVSIQSVGSTATAILGVFEPVTALFFGVVVFDETLTQRDFAGVLFIMVAVCYVVAGGNIAKAIVRVRKMFPRLSSRSHKD